MNARVRSRGWLLAMGCVLLGPALATVGGQESPAEPTPDHLEQRAEARLRALRDEADQLVAQQRGVLGRLRQLEVARQIAAEEVRRADAAVAAAEAESTQLESTIERLEQQRATVKPALEQRLVEIYKLGRARYARLLLSARSVRQVGQAARAVSALAAQDERRVHEYEQHLHELRSAVTELAAREKTLAQTRAAAVQARAAADQAIASQSALVRDIDQRRDLNAQLTGELQEVQRRLDGTLTAVGASADLPALPIGPFRGALPWPSPGPVVRRTDAGPGSAASRPGLEITAPEGSPVQAIHDGRVAYAGSFDGLGNLVVVDHGGQTFTLYGHLQEFEVAQGSVVSAGQPIGRVGASPLGRHTLYFELRVNGRPVDPLQWLARSRP